MKVSDIFISPPRLTAVPALEERSPRWISVRTSLLDHVPEHCQVFPAQALVLLADEVLLRLTVRFRNRLRGDPRLRFDPDPGMHIVGCRGNGMLYLKRKY